MERYYKNLGVAYGSRTRVARSTISRNNRYTKATIAMTFSL